MMISEFMMRIVKGREPYCILFGHLLSALLVNNTAENFNERPIDFGEYGNVIANTNHGFQSFAISGGICDQHTKLTRFGARDYDSYAGRWTAKDPAGFNYGEFNVYVYVENEPVNRVDPTGLRAKVEGGCCGKNSGFGDRIQEACDSPWANDIEGYYLLRSWRQCIKNKCNNGSIRCINCSTDPKHPRSGDTLGWAYLGNTWGPKQETYICANRATDSQVGPLAIHEWGHNCGWQHEDPKTGNGGWGPNDPFGFPWNGGPNKNTQYPPQPGEGPICASCTTWSD